jgi:hypothetical protein
MAPRDIPVRSAAALTAALLVFAVAQAQTREPTLEELETERLMDQASKAFERTDLSIEEISADFHYRCLRAIGDTTYCDCLVEKRPYTLRFEQYIGISTRTRSELAYETLSVHGKDIVDKVYHVRDECVGG